VLALAIAAVLVGQLLLRDGYESGMGNVVSMLGAFLGVVLLFGWAVLRGPWPRLTRVSLLGGGVAAVVLLATCVRIEGFSGAMLPKFGLRWSTPADVRLAEEQPAPAAAAAAAFPLVSALDYPRFLGPKGRAEVDGVRLARDWKAQPPKLLWRQPIGAGWSAFATVGDFAITQEQRGPQELVTCYDLKTGRLLWSHADVARFEEFLGGIGPRATPTIDEGRVYALGATGILNCLDGATGRVLWSKNILEENGAPNVQWGKSCSPLVTGNLVIVSAGGSGGRSLVAYDKLTGDRVWSAGDELSAYASPAEVTLAGVRQILIVNEAHVAGHDAETGQLLWEFSWPGQSNGPANAAQPVVLPGDRVFVSKGYGVGATLFQVRKGDDGTWAANEIWDGPKRVMKTKFANIVLKGGLAYGLDDGILECLDFATGRPRWKKGRYNHGQVMLVGDLLLVQSEEGRVALVEATPEGYRELGGFQAIEGKCWNNPALAQGRYLLVRNGEEAACYELALER
jgi:outer membrane protein assembly factor BamB